MPNLGTINSGSNVPRSIRTAATPGATVTLTLTDTTSIEEFDWTAGETETVNISGTHSAGKLLILKIANDATSGRTITLGTGFVANGTIAGLTSKSSQWMGVSNGTSFYEIARTVAI